MRFTITRAASPEAGDSAPVIHRASAVRRPLVLGSVVCRSFSVSGPESTLRNPGGTSRPRVSKSPSFENVCHGWRSHVVDGVNPSMVSFFGIQFGDPPRQLFQAQALGMGKRRVNRRWFDLH